MPNKKAAEKGLRQSIKRHAANEKLRTHVKFHFDNAQKLIEKGDKGAKAAVIAFQKAADKAAKRKAITPQRANHKKAALMKKVATK